MRFTTHGRTLMAFAILYPSTLPGEAPAASEIGNRLELFSDDSMVESLSGTAAYELKKPAPEDVALVTDAPWEGNISAYFTVLQDGDEYRMYYRGAHFENKKSTHPETVCCAVSPDGIHWTKPELGIVEFEGSTRNNIVWMGIGSHNFTPFIDRNPACPPDERYKAIAGEPRHGGLHAFVSADGFRWRPLQDKPVLPGSGWIFDSQNLAFWDDARNEYRLYYRTNEKSIRRISTATSPDLVNWSVGRELDYPEGTPVEQLYTNAILPYERAPHLLLGFPARYDAKSQQVEPLLMSSRDGNTFKRWAEPVIPLTAPKDRDRNRCNYIAWGLLRLPHCDRELSVYATEAYYEGPDSRIRRFTYRTDGFVSVKAVGGEGRLLTKPLIFAGERLQVNFTTTGQGSLRAELQDAEGIPIPDFTLADSQPTTGDEIAQSLSWSGGTDVGSLAGAPVRILFVLDDAELYSYQFQ